MPTASSSAVSCVHRVSALIKSLCCRRSQGKLISSCYVCLLIYFIHHPSLQFLEHLPLLGHDHRDDTRAEPQPVNAGGRLVPRATVVCTSPEKHLTRSEPQQVSGSSQSSNMWLMPESPTTAGAARAAAVVCEVGEQVGKHTARHGEFCY